MFALEIPFHPKQSDRFHSLYNRPEVITPLNSAHFKIVSLEPSFFKDTTIINFDGRSISFTKFDSFSGMPLWQYNYPEFSEYLQAMWENAKQNAINDIQIKKEKDKKKDKESLKLEFALPVHYPAWARRALGNEPPKLSIKGFQSIIITYDNTDIKLETGSDSYNPDQSIGNGGVNFDYENQFTITGSIGSRIHVQIKTGKTQGNDQQSFQDQMKTLLIEYKAPSDSGKALEDDIIQEITAGFTNFQMPGQGLAGYSGSHEGLFGVKIRSQLGPLSLTTVASTEKAETKKKKINPSQSTSSEYTIQELNYTRNIRFFLDTMYITKYKRPLSSNAYPTVTELKLYLLESRIGTKEDLGKTYIWGKYGDSDEYFRFRKLEENTDYFVDRVNGWITFDASSRPVDEDVLALYMQTSDGSTKGNKPSGEKTIGGVTGQFSDNLWVLKNKASVATSEADSTYNLMWRNIYQMTPNTNKSNIKVKVLRKVAGESLERNNKNIYFSDILGITKNGVPLSDQEEIFDFDRKIIVFPSYLDTVIGSDSIYDNHPFANPALGEYKGESNVNKLIYSDTATNVNSIYDIVTNGNMKQTSFQIAFGILPGSEKLVQTSSGKTLQKDIDYLIDYDFGSVDLISDAAKSGGEIEVDYQQESLFMFNSRQFVGTYGKLDLPNIGTNSYFATSLMGLFTSVRDKIPRVGMESYNRFLFDSNLHLAFAPDWMTNFVNLLPFLNLSSASSASLDLEVAGSYLKPDMSGKGQAYIDNFQSSQQEYSLGTSQYLWYQASPDADWLSDFEHHPPAWRFYWYAPRTDGEKSHRDELFMLTEEDSINKNYYLNTLRLTMNPVPTEGELLSGITDPNGVTGNSIVVDPWCGITNYVYPSYQDKSRDKYFELWVKNSTGAGVLTIDLGKVSEDISINGAKPDGFLTTEIYDYTDISNPKYDLGLDGQPSDSEKYYYPQFDWDNGGTSYWRSLGYHDSALIGTPMYEDPARDSYALYDVDHIDNYFRANGKEKDGKLTSEDINGDGLSSNNDFYRIRVDFSNIENSPFYDKEKSEAINKKNSGWVHLKIPINTPDDSANMELVGNPSWQKIEFVRMLWSGLKNDIEKKKESSLEFYDMKFSKNQWRGIASDIDNRTKIDASIYNSINDAAIFKSPFGKKDYLIDKMDKNKTITDYALKINYSDVSPGEDALVEKYLDSYRKVDISNYDEIRLWLKEIFAKLETASGKDLLEFSGGKLKDPASVQPEDLVKFTFRFGNNDSSYYEYKRPFADIIGTNVIYNDDKKERFWNSDNGLTFKLSDFTNLKLTYFKKYGNHPSSINVSDTLADGGIIRIVSKTGVMPNLSSVTWMAMGVSRDSSAVGSASGEIWANGLRVSGIKNIKGWAFRANLQTNWSDLFDIGASLSYDDADFRQMSENASSTKSSKISIGANTELHINKFFNSRFGLDIPLGFTLGESISRPVMRNGSDIRLEGSSGRVDKFSDISGDMADALLGTDISQKETPAEQYQTERVNYTWHVAYSKSRDAKNPVAKLTVDRLKASYSYSSDSTTVNEGPIADNEFDRISIDGIGKNHVNVTSTRSHNATVDYDLSPKRTPKWSYWKPFGKVSKAPRYLKRYKFNLLPSTIKFDLLRGSFSKSYRYRSLDDIDTSEALYNYTENLSVNHGFTYIYAPIDPLAKFTYSLNLDRNFDNLLYNWNKRGGVGYFVKNELFRFDDQWRYFFVLSEEKNRSQNISLDFNPQFMSWLTHKATYTSNYTQSPAMRNGDPNRYMKPTIKSSFTFNSSIRFNTLLSDLTSSFRKRGKIKKIVEKIEHGMDNIDFTTVSFNYSGSMNLVNNYIGVDYLNYKNIGRLDFLKYQFGLKGRNLCDVISGNMNDRMALGGVRSRLDGLVHPDFYQNDLRNTSQDYTISTSFNIPKPFYINVNSVALRWSKNYSVRPDYAYMDSTITFPDLSIGYSSKILENIAIVKKNLTDLSLHSSFGWKVSNHKTFNDYYSDPFAIKNNITKTVYFTPLIRTDGTLKVKKISFDYTMNLKNDYSISKITGSSDTLVTDTGDIDRKTTTENTWNVKYTIPGKNNRTFMLFKKWTVKIKGELIASLRIMLNKQKTRRHDSFDIERVDKQFSLSPTVSYKFTDNVEGNANYSFSRNYFFDSKKTQTDNKFALTVKVYFR